MPPRRAQPPLFPSPPPSWTPLLVKKEEDVDAKLEEGWEAYKEGVMSGTPDIKAEDHGSTIEHKVSAVNLAVMGRLTGGCSSVLREILD